MRFLPEASLLTKLSVLSLFIFSETPAIAALDAPHNISESMGCLSCHDLASSDHNHLPALGHTPIPGNLADTVANNLCWSCHLDINKVSEACVISATHSSLNSVKTEYGEWSVECRVCHNQHSQEQPGAKFIRTSINLAQIKYAGTTPPKTGVRPVTYTGTADLADGDGDYQGICEVCHTKTMYHRNSGSGNHSHYPGQHCITCHDHNNGFLHGGGSGGNGCISCHGHDPGYEYAAGKFSQGKGTFTSHSAHTEHDPPDDSNGPNLACDACHDIDHFPYFKSGSDGNGDSLFSLAETTVCDPCHNDATGIATGTPLLQPPPEWNTSSLTCTGCHAIGPSYTSGSPKANSHSVHSSLACGACHAATSVNGTAIADITAHLDGAYTLQPGTGISFTYAFHAGGGTCSGISCHGNQNATWGTALRCDSCHGYPPVPGDGKDINDQFDGGKGAHVTSWDTMDGWGMGGHIINPVNLDPVNDVYGDDNTGYHECMKCHLNGTHASGTIEVLISEDPWSTNTNKGFYDRPGGFGLMSTPLYNGIPGDTITPKTCSGIICHQGDTPRWSCSLSE